MRFELTASEFGSDNVATLASMQTSGSTHDCSGLWKMLASRLRSNSAILKGCSSTDVVALANYHLRSIDKSYIAPSRLSDGRCSVMYVVIFG